MTRNKHAQIARHAAIVLAGAASLSLTVVAGTYIVHQMADIDRPGGALAAPPVQAVEDATNDPEWVDTVLTGGSFELPPSYSRHSHDVAVPAPKAAESQTYSLPAPRRATVGGTLLLGDAYLDAQVTAAPADTIAITLGTNARTVLTGRPNQERLDDRADITELRTEFDTRSGAVVLMLTDPSLGDHDLRFERNPAPKSAIPAPGTDSPTTPAKQTPRASTQRGPEPSVSV
ncbi:hypothetical protein [Nocardia sp. NPDC052316]|uniref:hypothetical protein n=1 Tax=Nocardia sp. NPDC052316 TaxID=3364329 RepID=UPI0037CC42B0